MKINKIFQLLGTFRAKELKGFRKYLVGNYGKREGLIEIFDFISKFHPKFQSEQLKNENAFKKIFGSKRKFSYSKLTDGYGELYRIGKEYIICKEKIQYNFENNWILLNHYRDRGAKKLYLKQWKEMFKNFGSDLELGHYYKMKLYEIRSLPGDHLKPDDFQYKENIENLVTNLDTFYLKKKLEFATDKKNRERSNQEKFSYPLIDSILENRTIFEKTAILKFKYSIFDLVVSQSEEKFEKLLDILLHDSDNLSKNDIRLTLVYLQNFCINQIRSGNTTKYYKNLFKILDFSSKKRLLFEEGFISPHKFNNAIHVACKLKKLDWADAFISEWKEFLPKNVKIPLTKIAIGEIQFLKKNFRGVLFILESESFRNQTFGFISRAFILRSYYELGEDYEKIHNYCSSFEAFIRRWEKEINQKVYASHLNFVLFVKRLISINSNNILKLKSDIENEKFNIRKDWLLEKIAEKGA